MSFIRRTENTPEIDKDAYVCVTQKGQPKQWLINKTIQLCKQWSDFIMRAPLSVTLVPTPRNQNKEKCHGWSETGPSVKGRTLFISPHPNTITVSCLTGGGVGGGGGVSLTSVISVGSCRWGGWGHCQGEGDGHSWCLVS